MRLVYAFFSFSTVAGAWLDWLWGSDESALRFDLASAPILVNDPRLFPEAYREEMAWGTYRPGIYFGVKARHANSLLLGLAWGSMDGKVLRHECESGDLQAFNWLEHDGRNYGRQSLEDQKLQLKLDTTFVKEGALLGRPLKYFICSIIGFLKVFQGIKYRKFFVRGF